MRHNHAGSWRGRRTGGSGARAAGAAQAVGMSGISGIVRATGISSIAGAGTRMGTRAGMTARGPLRACRRTGLSAAAEARRRAVGVTAAALGRRDRGRGPIALGAGVGFGVGFGAGMLVGAVTLARGRAERATELANEPASGGSEQAPGTRPSRDLDGAATDTPGQAPWAGRGR